MAEETGNLNEIWAAACDAAEPFLDVKCPGCEKDLRIKRKALFEKNTLTSRITVKEGHYLQASTIGGMISEMAKLLKCAGKEMGNKIDIFITSIRYDGAELEIKYMSLEAGKQPQREEVARVRDPEHRPNASGM